MSRKHALIAVATMLCSTSAFADDAATGPSRTAWYWQARARSDKAEEAWKEVLRISPDDPSALAALGGFAARAGRVDDARGMLARLEKASPSHPDVAVLRRELQLGPKFGTLLAQARKLVHEGHVADGAAKYRQLFGEAGPPGDLALEFYETIAGAPGGWTEARDGLRKLTRRAPDEPRFKLALGKLLTWREETRREGLTMLTSVAHDPAMRREAEEAERQALLWLSPEPRDLPMLREWIKAHPKDEEVARKLTGDRKAGAVKEAYEALDRGNLDRAAQLFHSLGDTPDARRGLSLIAARRRSQANKQGFAALERGDIAGARQTFSKVGDDNDARLGLALADVKEAAKAMEAQDFARARPLLEQARDLAPRRPDLWEAPLRSATFWGLMREADQAQAAGRNAEARSRIEEAARQAPADQRYAVELRLADLAAADRDFDQAEQRYRAVLQAVPDQPNALRGMASVLVQEGRYADAIPLNDRLARIAPAQALHGPWLRAESLRTSAAKATAAGDLTSARAQLEDARQSDPSDVWALHDLANLDLRIGAFEDARPLVAELLRLAPALPEARATQARLLAAEGRYEEALAALDASHSRDPSLLALRRKLRVTIELPRIVALAAQGERAQAVAQLGAIDPGSDPDLIARVALTWSKLGEPHRAVAVMRTAIAAAPSSTVGARLQLAGALLAAGADADAAQLLEGLGRAPNLTPSERASFVQLSTSLTVRKADALRERGDARAAVAVLQPALRETPASVPLQSAMARAEETLDRGRAHAFYLAVLRASPRDLEALRGAADTTSDVREARDLADTAVRTHPQDPRAWELSGRVHERGGDDSAAAADFRRALQADRSAAQFDLSPGVSTSGFSEGAPRMTAAERDPFERQIASDLQRIDDRHRPAFDGSFGYRTRSGESGLGQLTDFRETIEAVVPLGYWARGSLQISEIELDPGRIGASAAPRYGTGSAAARPGAAATGTELRARFDARNFSAEIGTTPLRFSVFSVLGGARVHGELGPFKLGLGASRTSVTDSALSWAGATDPGTGQHWGGVVLDSGRFDVALEGSAGAIFAYAEAGRLIGLRVADNTRVAAGGGAQLVIVEGDFGRIAAGPAVAALAFDKNQNFFTFGQGGYFSPQRFIHGGFALRWSRDGDVRWDLRAEPGYDHYDEAHAAIFPLAPDGQLFPGQSNGGPSFNGSAFLGLSPVHGFELGLNAALQTAPEFQEVRAGVVLRIGPR